MNARTTRSIAEITQAIEQNPNNAYAYFWRGEAYMERDEFDHAILDLTQAIQLEPDYIDAYIVRGNAYVLKGDYDNAINDYIKTTDLDPTNFVGYNNLGAVYNRLANAYLDKAKALREEKDRQEALLTG